MTRLLDLTLRAFNSGLLESASRLVPERRRREWKREWQAEVWHVRRAEAPIGSNGFYRERKVLVFCLGAFPDAWCLRSENRRIDQFKPAPQGSAWQCLLLLAAVLAAGYVLALRLPEVRAAMSSLRSGARPGSILIRQDAAKGPADPTLTFSRYQDWSWRKNRYFDGFAFYSLRREKVTAGSEAPSSWQVAEATANLFALLGLRLQVGDGDDVADGPWPGIILSNAVWRREFSANPGIVGSLVEVGRRRGRILGVAADRVWKLPGHPDAWLLEPDETIGADRRGQVVAHLTRQGRSEMWADRVQITAHNGDHTEQDYLGIAIDEPSPLPWAIYRFSVLLALLALPAITSVSLGQYALSAHRPPWPRRTVRWVYLGAKFALLLLIAYFIPLDCAYWHASQQTFASEYAQLLVCFAICLWGARWALLDQRQRCPVCLKRVAHPAQVGLASRTFLAWNGTELMCTGGHTLLHVPSLPTSWFATQRWLYLDASWEFLFAGRQAG
jgi:hypothetical protein